MALCPNRNRKRAGLGGGAPGCEGRVDVVVLVPLSLPCKRLPRGADGAAELLTSRVRRNGVRVEADTLKRLVDGGKYDVCCQLCGWSLNRACAQASKSRKR